MKNISILGSTGFIGTRALDVVRSHGDELKVSAMTAHKNVSLFLKQIEEFRPSLVGMTDIDAAREAAPHIPKWCRFVQGKDAVTEIASYEKSDVALVAIVGIAALPAVVAALETGHDVALASKEALVTGGGLVTELAKKHGARLLPVDSEHSAIFQCLEGAQDGDRFDILLTASGGPFRKWKKEDIARAKAAEALKHPTWSMGRKITIDSSTLMNKGLEIIEAGWLFGVHGENIHVVVHPQSVIHSMIRYGDGSVIGQMGAPDMRLPIQYALLYPERRECPCDKLDLLSVPELTFERPDEERFPCLALARYAMKKGGLAPTVLNSANEIAVDYFLRDEIGFYDISDTVSEMLKSRLSDLPADSIASVYSTDEEIRRRSSEYIEKRIIRR